MARDGDEIDALIALMARLPGLGPRSAKRAVLAMIERRAQLLDPLTAALAEVSAKVRACVICGNLGTGDRCAICANAGRAADVICVVEDVGALWALERTGAFRGRYHVLGGVLSALDGVGPEELRIPALLDRVREEAVREVILALNVTVDGRTTAHYIADKLEPLGIAVTSLAQGVPVGGELDYLDDGTISAALTARKAL